MYKYIVMFIDISLKSFMNEGNVIIRTLQIDARNYCFFRKLKNLDYLMSQNFIKRTVRIQSLIKAVKSLIFGF